MFSIFIYKTPIFIGVDINKGFFVVWFIMQYNVIFIYVSFVYIIA